MRLLAVLLAQRLQLRTARRPLLQRLQRFFQQRFQLGVQRALRILAGEGHANRVLRTAGEQTIQVQRAAGFRTGTGQPFAAERLHADHRANHIAVDVQVAHLRAAGDLGDGLVDAGMHAERQAVARGVNLLHQFVQLVTVIAHHVQHRAEDLFFQLVEAIEFDKRRRHKGPVAPFACVFAILAHRLVDGASFGAHRLNMAFNILFRFRIDNRADIGGQPARIAHPALAHGAAQHGQRMVGDLFLQAEDAQGGAALAGAVERGSQDVDHHLLGQRRRVDDHRVHPAGFGDQRRRATLGIEAAGNITLQQRRHFGGAGEHHAAYALIGG